MKNKYKNLPDSVFIKTVPYPWWKFWLWPQRKTVTISMIKELKQKVIYPPGNIEFKRILPEQNKDEIGLNYSRTYRSMTLEEIINKYPVGEYKDAKSGDFIDLQKHCNLISKWLYENTENTIIEYLRRFDKTALIRLRDKINQALID